MRSAARAWRQAEYYHALIGGNFRIDELQAAVLRVKLKYLDGWTQGRQRNAAYYDKAFAAAGLGSKLRTPLAMAGYRHIFNQYVVRVQNREALRARLTERGIGTEIYYPVPLHVQQCFAYLGYRAGDFPHSELAAAETLALPIYPELAQAQLAHVVASIAEFYAQGSKSSGAAGAATAACGNPCGCALARRAAWLTLPPVICRICDR